MDQLLKGTGIYSIVSKSFASVFESLDVATESWFQRKKIFQFSNEKYSKWICEVIGKYPLFGSERTTNVEDSYIPVGISTKIEREIYRSSKDIENQLLNQKMGIVNSSPNNKNNIITLIEAVKRYGSGLALLGSAGSGKTTSFKQLAVLAAKGEVLLERRRFPIFISVRELEEGPKSLWQGMIRYLENFEISRPSAVLWSLLKSGQTMILVDGIDETSESNQKELIREIVNLEKINKRRREKKNIICVSGRPFSLGIGLANFTKLEVLPFEKEQKEEFILKWFKELSPYKGERLCLKLRSSDMINDLSSTPLLLSLICALYHNELELPTEKEELLERATKGLLGSWDHFRGIARSTFFANLSMKRRLVFMSFIAYYLFINKKIVFSLSDTENIGVIKAASRLVELQEVDDETVLNSLYSDFSILIQRSPKLYSFCHLSFQEYLTAKHAVDSRKELKLLESIIKDPERYYDVIKYLAKLLPDADTFIKELFSKMDWSNKDTSELVAIFLKESPIISPRVKFNLRVDAEKLLATLFEYIIKNKVQFFFSEGTNTLCFEYKSYGNILRQFSNLINFVKIVGWNITDIRPNSKFGIYIKTNKITVIEGIHYFEKRDSNDNNDISKDIKTLELIQITQ